MKNILGIDLGSSSNGWTLRNEKNEFKSGVVTFDSGMQKGQQGGYTSPTKERREARSKRNLIRARKYRKWALLEILYKEFIPIELHELENWSKYKKGQERKYPENNLFKQWLKCDFTYLENGKKYNNPYELRIAAIEEKVTKHELGRALYHIIQRRGFKDIGEKNKETEKQIERRTTSGLKDAIDYSRTLAEALKTNFVDKNQRARNHYPYREEYDYELEFILKTQGYNTEKENGKYIDKFVQSIWEAIIWQRPLRTQKGNIGKCSLEPTKLRCPISHPIYEIFRAWSFINTIRYFDEKSIKHELSNPTKNELYQSLFLKKDKNFKFEDIRKFLDKKLNGKFEYNYPFDYKSQTYDSSVAGMPMCKSLIEVFGDKVCDAFNEIEKYNIGNAPKIISNYSIFDLWHILFEFEDLNKLTDFSIKKLDINNQIKKDKTFNPFTKCKDVIEKGYADLSVKAMCKIIPFLKEGYLYNEAVLLAKIPDILGDNWNLKEQIVRNIIKESNTEYSNEKEIVIIANKLIDNYKGLVYPYLFAEGDYTYELKNNHDEEIFQACIGHFGSNDWGKISNKDYIFKKVKNHYESFFKDLNRKYIETKTLNNIFFHKLKLENININKDSKLYHHSKKENKYGEASINKAGIKILPIARIDSIKNPMFNKSLSILRKLINHLIINDKINEDTEVVIEIARELNDNNKRAAIERYQNERRNNREKYRQFLEQYNEHHSISLNVEDKIGVFELWSEQIYENGHDEIGKDFKNQNRIEILREKEAVKRYELWMEQKGQCMYTGKMISISQLFSNTIDIEHTIPRSLLPDNTLANQTVAFKTYNTQIKKTLLPTECPNYQTITNVGTPILPRLDNWIKIRDDYKKRYEQKLKGQGNEDENAKNKRIQEKHYLKLHLDYWTDKVYRFTAMQVKDSWARRQLTDTQMISKYAREYLKTYFKKVSVQKGETTADFRKIFQFQEIDEIKNRNKHTHHAIDAAVLTLIPTNSSYKEKLLKEYYKALEEKRNFTISPFAKFNSQEIIRKIEEEVLIINYEKDTLLKETNKNVRKRGLIQYVKDKKGKFILDSNSNKIIKKAQGDTVRSTLFQQTFLGKIKDVERDENGQPKRDGKDWKFKTGNDEFLFVERKPINEVKTKYINDIIDPVIKKIVLEQKNNEDIFDYQGKKIRHVRIKSNKGKKVKERVNYRSEKEYKNFYYAGAGSLPYAVLLQKDTERKMFPVSSFEVTKNHKTYGYFNIDEFVNSNHPEFIDYPSKQLLKVGQKVFVLNEDNDYVKRNNIDFQTKRMYVITQFSDGNIWLQYHLEAQKLNDIKMSVKMEKDEILKLIDKKLGLPEFEENKSILDAKERKKDFEDKKYGFDLISRPRFERLKPFLSENEIKDIKTNLDKLKVFSSIIESEGKTPLLKTSSENWNFIYENIDFLISIDGSIEWI